MAQELPKFNSDYRVVSDLMPKYDGNPKTLNHYIREVDRLAALVDSEGNSLVLTGLIKSRLSGSAIDAIAYEEDISSWPKIRNALIRRLGEPRNEIQIMQELTRTRRGKNEDAETFGKRLRDLLDILNSVGKHSDRSYYENMVIEQYVNQLETNISLGVRITKPETLEIAIVNARQEEARLTYNRSTQQTYNNNTQNTRPKIQQDFNSPNQSMVYPGRYLPHTQQQQPLQPPQPQQPRFRFPMNPGDRNFVPRQNNWTPEQRQQWAQSMMPWKARPETSKSGNVRNQLGSPRNLQQNVPQQINAPQKFSDVTMRSVHRNPPPQFVFEELNYAPQYSYYPNDYYEPYYEPYSHDHNVNMYQCNSPQQYITDDSVQDDLTNENEQSDFQMDTRDTKDK